jgi:MFS family permease
VWLPKWLIPAGLTIGFTNIHYPVITGFLILHLSQHGGAGATAFSAYALLVLISRFFLGGLPDRVAPSITFYVGIACMTVGIVILTFTNGPIVSVVGAIILGFGFSFPWASVASTVLKRTPAHQRGSAVGVLSAFYDLFVGTSSFAAGGLAGKFGYRASFLLALGGILVAAFAGRFVFRQIPERSSD